MSQDPTCKFCGSEVTPGRVRKGDLRCRDCVREMTRKNRARTHAKAQVDPQNKAKNRARRETQYAIRTGALVRGACEACGSKQTEAHHDDYSQPLNVRWLCPEHHRAHHLAEGLPRKRDAHCLQGHPLSGANLYVRPDGKRTCITCQQQRDRAYRERQSHQHLTQAGPSTARGNGGTR